MEDKGESKFRNVMERYWYALFIIAVALAAAVIGFICEAWKMQEGFLYDLLTYHRPHFETLPSLVVADDPKEVLSLRLYSGQRFFS